MTEESINKTYVSKYLERAQSTDNEDLRKDALYRVGTHLEVIPCNGNTNLTPVQQERVVKAASSALGAEANGS